MSPGIILGDHGFILENNLPDLGRDALLTITVIQARTPIASVIGPTTISSTKYERMKSNNPNRVRIHSTQKKKVSCCSC